MTVGVIRETSMEMKRNSMEVMDNLGNVLRGGRTTNHIGSLEKCILAGFWLALAGFWLVLAAVSLIFFACGSFWLFFLCFSLILIEFL